MRAPTRTTVRAALEAYVAGMEDGTILDRSGNRYKPATCRRYGTAVRLHLAPVLGHFKLSELARSDVQSFADRQRGGGAAPSTVHNVLDPLRAVYRRALQRDEATVDPTQRLALPGVRGGRDRIVDPAGAEALIDALPASEQALWAAAIYTGARRGELRELRWSDVNLDAGTIRVERARDDYGDVIATKTAAGCRVVPIVPRLRRHLAAHKLATGRSGEELVFGRTPVEPFVPSTVRNRARKAWKAAGLEPLGLHEGRHTCASLLIDAGVNDKALSAIMGHASVTITKDRYGHLMPDGVAEAGRLLEARLERGAGAHA